MTFPNFLGIGAMRAGTSWLFVQLRSHKDVYISEQKELNFFNDFYDRGIGWYTSHFPSPKDSVKYRAIGEITPTYMADPETASRIHAHVPDSRFVVMLRNPVNRAYSEYTKTLRNLNFQGTFDEFIAQTKGVLERGYYSKQLERYFEFFPRDQFLFLIFEDAISDHQATIYKLASFLEIDPNGFDVNRMKQTINSSYLPRAPGLYASAVKLRRFLVKKNLGWVPPMAEKIGLISASRYVFQFRGPRSDLPKMDENTRKRLNHLYRAEVHTLQKLLGHDLSVWRI
jgi:hypothetical protein